MKRTVFPFTAVLGQEKVKEALIWNAINPRIGGLLISGEKGTAKSTLVRGLADILGGMTVVELPLNVSEDRLVGSLNFEKAVREGRTHFEPGLLHQAHGNILYADEVNLLSDHIVNTLLEVSASGINIVEREGISCSHAARFILVGTMNPEEGMLRSQFLDRFGLFVRVRGNGCMEERMEIIRRRLAYESDPIGYIKVWSDQNTALSERIVQSGLRLPQVRVSHSMLRRAAEIALQGCCAGHRADLILIEASRALAAWNEAGEVTGEMLERAAEYVLPHRLREEPVEDRRSRSHQPEDPPSEQKPASRKETEAGMEEQGNIRNDDDGTRPDFPDHQPKADDGADQIEDWDDADPIHLSNQFCLDWKDRRTRKGSGRRNKTRTALTQGRYVKYTFPKGEVRDLALDATLRAALPFQTQRSHDRVAVAIHRCDFREKMREKRTGSTILFIVDASGSMGARRRMREVKKAILTMLQEAYQKRDRVGMIVFRRNAAEMVLPVTRSIDLAQKQLRSMPTGGNTPLAQGLELGYQVLRAEKLRNPEMIPLLVLVSDGRANAGENSSEDSPYQNAMRIAAKLGMEGVPALVLDTEEGYVQLGLLRNIAEAMQGEYVKLDLLRENHIVKLVKGHTR